MFEDGQNTGHAYIVVVRDFFIANQWKKREGETW
jgi:hypothetical protein